MDGCSRWKLSHRKYGINGNRSRFSCSHPNSNWTLLIFKCAIKKFPIENKKFCHFFNNGKTCPYEKIGCKFLHQPSATCYFGEKCKNKLCQYRHIVLDNDSDEKESNDLKNNINKLTEMEKDETKEVFCDI